MFNLLYWEVHLWGHCCCFSSFVSSYVDRGLVSWDVGLHYTGWLWLRRWSGVGSSVPSSNCPHVEVSVGLLFYIRVSQQEQDMKKITPMLFQRLLRNTEEVSAARVEGDRKLWIRRGTADRVTAEIRVTKDVFKLMHKGSMRKSLFLPVFVSFLGDFEKTKFP